MLKEVEIQNYLSHKKTKLVLHEGVNVLAGDSDAGKSAIIQALGWCWYNSPDGWSFKSWFRGVKETKVTTLFDDHSIVRKKNTKDNQYIIDDEVLEKVGTRLPEKVAQASGITKINFREQHGKYFLLQETAGKVAEYLNELVGLSLIDKLTDEVASISRRTKTQWESEKTTVTRLTEELIQFNDLDRREALLREAQALEVEVNRLTAEHERLQYLNSEYERLETQLNNVTDWLLVEPHYTSTKSILGELEKLTSERARLEALEANFSRLNSSLETLNSWLGVRAGFNSLTALNSDLGALNTEYTKLHNLFQKWNSLEAQLLNSTDRLELVKQEYENALTELGICPVCGAEFTEEHVDRILR